MLSPVVSSTGKYLVRILYLEKNGEITMDDHWPAGGSNRLPLPIAMTGNEQRLTIKMKALLKNALLRILL